MSITTKVSHTTDDEISLAEIWEALASRAALIISCTVAAAAIAAGIAFSMTPIYRAETLLAVVEQSGGTGGGLSSLAGQFGGLAGLAGVSLGGSADRSEAMGTLNSKRLAESFITERQLLPVLYPESWDAEAQQWKSSVRQPPTVWKATEKFTKEIRRVSDDKKTGLVTVAVEWRDAQQAAEWTNELVKRANASLRARAITKSDANLVYLNAELEKSSVVELRQAIYRLIESEVKNVMLARGNEEFAFKVIDPAVTPERKTKPKRALIVIVGAFLGLMFSSIYALVKGRTA